MSSKKSGGSTSNGRSSAGQRRGIKKFSGQVVKAGEIIVRQLGTVFLSGKNTGLGKDFTLYSKLNGLVKFERAGKKKVQVNVYPV